MILRLALLSALCVFSGFGEQQGSKLLGKWRSVTMSKGGIGALLDFRPGGRFDYIPAAIVPGRYSVEEQRLTMTDSDGEQTVMNIEAISTETLRLGVPKAGSLDLKRVGRPEDPEHLLLGVWVTVQAMEGLPSRGYYYFRSDGTETFTVPFRTDQCQYWRPDPDDLSAAGLGGRRGSLGGRRTGAAVERWRSEVQAVLTSRSARLYRCGGRRSPVVERIFSFIAVVSFHCGEGLRVTCARAAATFPRNTGMPWASASRLTSARPPLRTTSDMQP
jgi:hypothetical protein